MASATGDRVLARRISGDQVAALTVMVVRSEFVSRETEVQVGEKDIASLAMFVSALRARLQIDTKEKLALTYDDPRHEEADFVPLTTARIKEAASSPDWHRRIRVCVDPDPRDLSEVASDAAAALVAAYSHGRGLQDDDAGAALGELSSARVACFKAAGIEQHDWVALSGAFDEIDADNSHTISIGELHEALKQHEEDLSEADMKELWVEICGGKAAADGIDFAGFCKFAHSPNLGVRRAAKERARRDNYWLRPAAPKLGEPHLFVDIRFVLFKLTNVDTVAGSAFVKVSLIAYWTDPRVKGWVGPLPEQLWGPAFNLTNGLGDLTVTQDEFELLDKSTGRLKRTFVYEGTIDNPMDLRAFPCDFDDLPMTFTTMSRWMCNDGSASGKVPRGRSYRVRKVREKNEGRWMRLDRFQQVPEFELHGISSQIDEWPPNEAGSERTVITVSFHISRDSWFYFEKVLFPVFLLTTLSLHVYLFDPINISDRVATTATYFLAAFAMLYVVSDSIPKTSFLTKVDAMIFLSLLNLLIAAITTVVLYVYVAHGGDGGTHRHRSDPEADIGSDLLENRQSVNNTVEQNGQQARSHTADVIDFWIAVITAVIYVISCIYWFVPMAIHQRKVRHDLTADYPPVRPALEPGTSRAAVGDDYTEVEREATPLLDGSKKQIDSADVDLEASQYTQDAWWCDAERLHQWYIELVPDFALKNLILDNDEALKKYSIAEVKQLEHGRLLEIAQEIGIDSTQIEEADEQEKSHRERWGGVDRIQPPETLRAKCSYKAVTLDGVSGALLYTIDANVITRKAPHW